MADKARATGGGGRPGGAQVPEGDEAPCHAPAGRRGGLRRGGLGIGGGAPLSLAASPCRAPAPRVAAVSSPPLCRAAGASCRATQARPHDCRQTQAVQGSGRLLPGNPSIPTGSGLALMPPFVDSRRCVGRAVIGHRRHAPHRCLDSRAGTGRDESTFPSRPGGGGGGPRADASRAGRRAGRSGRGAVHGTAKGRRRTRMQKAGAATTASQEAGGGSAPLCSHPRAGRRQDLIWPGAAGGA